MLSSRNKIIILIVGAIIVLGMIVVTVFNLWPGAKPEETISPEPVDLSFLKKDETLPSGAVFDASNKEEFAALTGDANLESALSPLERQARDLAEFFVERFGTYSTDASWAQIDDLQPFMTAAMQSWTMRFKASSPQRDGYFATTAEVVAADRLSFSALEQRAQFSLLTNRTETSGGKTDSFQQAATVELRQDGSGAWQVNSLFWGDKR